jgi:glycosyltransferase involved in cell wall biosynthesis
MYRKAGVPEDRLYITPNGARSDLFEFTKESKFPDRSIFLAKITDRKKQYLYQNLDFIDFAGNIDDYRFNTSRSNFLGEWTKEFLYKNLTNYSNLVLLSDGEAHPLVCCEALVCGLGLVVSEFAAANLDTSLPFIDVVPTDKLNDLEYVSQIIRKNQSISSSMREEIREYGLNNFDWTKIVKSYSELVQNICK